MKRCPITYEEISNGQNYSIRGLHLLSSQLEDLAPLPLTAQQQQSEAIARVGKMSIQGVQPKLSAILKIKDERFEIVDSHGQFILKTQSPLYPEIPENEAITMSLAATIGLEVPVHGLVYAIDNTMTYFIKRFDRLPKQKKIAIEDFSQLSGLSRDTKYDSSMEQVAKVIAMYCTYPKVEYVKLFKLTLFNFLIGNEDMHLKNFSLISRNNIVTLSPVYDLVNSSIALSKPVEEMALSLMGRKRNLTKNNLIKYFGKERLELNDKIVSDVINDIKANIPLWRDMLQVCFLSEKMKEAYLNLLNERYQRLF